MKKSKSESFNGLIPFKDGDGVTGPSNRMATMILLFLILLTIGLETGARGGAPSGSFEYALSAQDGVPLWNFSGPYVLPYGSGYLHQDSGGKIVASYDALGVGPVGLVGAIGGAGANLEMRLHSGMAVPELVTDGGMQFGVNRKDKLSLSFDAKTGALTGTDRVSRTREEVEYGSRDSFWESDHTYIKRTTSVSVQSVATTVPESTDGNWTLSLEIVPAENKLSGTAAITFSNGEVFRFQILGRFSPKTGKTALHLKGYGVDKGANLSLFISGPNMKIESMHGAVGGQRIRFSQA